MEAAVDDAPCSAWSMHAAELAAPLSAELQCWRESPAMDAMIADGLLERLVPGVFIPPDLLNSSVRRALLLGSALGAGLRRHHVIGGRSAAWVFLGGRAPCPAELLTMAHRSPLAGVQVRHAALAPGDVETLGGAPVTSPVRTALDLLRFADMGTAMAAVRLLLDSGHVTEHEVLRHLRSVSHHYLTRTARRRLELLLSGEAQARDSGAASATGFPSAVTR